MKNLLDNKIFQAVVIALCVVVMCLSVVSIIHSMRGMSGYAAEPASAPTATAVPTLPPTPTPVPTPAPTPEPTPEPYAAPEELDTLRSENGHVIALLDIPDTEIRYPILQHPTADNYYLNITIDGEEGYPGSIYTNTMEGQDFATFNTVIYGHNMRDGSFFGSLKSFRDPDYLAAHRELDVYTPTEKHAYDIFAVVVYDDRYITDVFKDDDAADRAAFLQSLQTAGWDKILLDDVAVDADSHIVTLSTCIDGMHDNRLLIVAAERV